MKYTLAQALQIVSTLPIKAELTSIMFEDSSMNKVIVGFSDGKQYFISLVERTYKIIN